MVPRSAVAMVGGTILGPVALPLLLCLMPLGLTLFGRFFGFDFLAERFVFGVFGLAAFVFVFGFFGRVGFIFGFVITFAVVRFAFVVAAAEDEGRRAGRG